MVKDLVVALARAGHRVGLMDADIYGPNIPRMMGVDQKPEVRSGKIQPLEAHGVKLMSLALIVERDSPAIWRGPIIMKVIGQFVKDVDWGELDYFLVDLPPGTGDAQLSLAQTVHIRAAIIVTTPQEVAVGDSLRGAKMFERVGVPVLGVVENMSYFVCPHCGERTEIFRAGGGSRLAGGAGPRGRRPAGFGCAGRAAALTVRVLLLALSLVQHPRAERPDVRAGLDTLYGGGFPAAAAYFAELAGRDSTDPAPVTFEASAYIWWAAALENDAYEATRSAGSPTCAGQPRREIWRGSRPAGCSRRRWCARQRAIRRSVRRSSGTPATRWSASPRVIPGIRCSIDSCERPPSLRLELP